MSKLGAKLLIRHNHNYQLSYEIKFFAVSANCAFKNGYLLK
jgi:hypothetical protein